MDQRNPNEPSTEKANTTTSLSRSTTAIYPIDGLTFALKTLYLLHIVLSFVGLSLLISICFDPIFKPDTAKVVKEFLVLIGFFYFGTAVVLSLSTIALHAIWTYRASHNTEVLGAVDKQFTPNWSLGWFFVPIANLIMPYRVAVEVYLASIPGPAGVSWRYEPAPLFIGFWWTCFVLRSLLNFPFLGSPALAELVPAGLIQSLAIGGEILGMVAAVLAIKFVDSVADRQSRQSAIASA